MPLTKQEVFDRVARHLLTQNAKALNGAGACCYRAPDGKKCAAGCLIPDECYNPAIEGIGARSLFDESFHCSDLPNGVYLAAMCLREKLGKTTYDVAVLIRELQTLHDWRPVENWREELRNLAEQLRYALDPAVLSEFP